MSFTSAVKRSQLAPDASSSGFTVRGISTSRMREIACSESRITVSGAQTSWVTTETNSSLMRSTALRWVMSWICETRKSTSPLRFMSKAIS